MEKAKLSNEEKMVLKEAVGQGYKYIARTEWGCIGFHQSAPYKSASSWCSSEKIGYISPLSHLFKFIKWENEEPTLIADLLKE